MKIALVIQKLVATHGGAESWTVQLAKWLAARNHDVHCFCMRSSDFEGSEGMRICTLNKNRGRFSAVTVLSQHLSSEKYDIIHDMGFGTDFDIFQSHIGSMKAIEQAKRLCASPVRRIADQFFQPFSARRRQLLKHSARQFSHSSAWYIAVSKMVAKGLESLEHIPTNRIFTINNGVDTAKFHPDAILHQRDAIRHKWSIGADELVLVTMAHNHRLKGIPQLVSFLRNQLACSTKLHLVVAGGHDQQPTQIAVGKHTVTFLGAIDEPLDAYAIADIYIHPTFYDACSLSVLEAMACGLPAIASRRNGAAERIVDGKNGFLIESALDEAGILNSIKALESPEIRERIGSNARQSAERWTLEDNFLSIELLYQAKREVKQSNPQITHTALRMAS